MGPRSRGSPRHLPQHADDARASRSAATSSTGRARSPARSTPAAATRPRRSRSRPRWAATTSARRSTATWACTSSAASSRGGSSPTTWAAPTARRRARTATSTWPTTTSASSRWSRTCRRCCRSRSAARSPSGSARRSASPSAGSARASSARGDAHEAMNFAGVRQLPVVFVCDNNQWAYSTPTHLEYAVEHLADRAAAYGFEGVVVDGTDALAVYREAKRAIEKARQGGGPTLIECDHAPDGRPRRPRRRLLRPARALRAVGRARPDRALPRTGCASTPS